MHEPAARGRDGNRDRRGGATRNRRRVLVAGMEWINLAFGSLILAAFALWAVAWVAVMLFVALRSIRRS